MRTTLPLAIAFVIGSLMIIEFFVPHGGFRDVLNMLRDWGTVITACAFVLGAVNVLQVNLPKIRRREAGWGYRVVLVGSAFAMMSAGFLAGGEFVVPKDSTGGLQHTFIPVYKWLFDSFFAPPNATMFALLAFFVASAAFRAFRARNVEATLMLGAAIIVMIGVTPLGEKVPFVDFTSIKDWILDYANNGGRRAILIGAALGAVATGLRVVLGIERSHLGAD